MRKTDSVQLGIRDRFDVFIEAIGRTLGHSARQIPFRDYCTGLLLPIERKSVEPMAARLDPADAGRKHQSLHHFVADGSWNDELVLRAIREQALPRLKPLGPIRAWIVDDTAHLKKGRGSVGVARQYCGRIGKQDNCQVAVSLSIASSKWSLPVGYRLYLPEVWASDSPRRLDAGVPEEVEFQTKPQIALDQVEAAMRSGIDQAPVLADAGYGNNTEFREQLTEWDLPYAVGIQGTTTVWSRTVPDSSNRRGGSDLSEAPRSVRDLALAQPATRFREVTWREGTKGRMRSRFLALRVQAAHREALGLEEWLLIEWPAGEPEPTKYFLSTLPSSTSLRNLVDLTKLRWRIERDYEELKSELGLSHYEGRGWRGFHHHATLCIAAYAFLAA